MNLLRIARNIKPFVCIDNFLTDSDIEKIIEYSKKIPTTTGKVGVNNSQNITIPFILDHNIKDTRIGNVPSQRKSDIKWIELDKETDWIYKKIIKQINQVNQENFDFILKFVENLQFTEYSDKQSGFYAPHYDCGYKKSMENYVDVRKLSFSVQLSDEKDYDGGELILYIDEKEYICPKNKGTIIFFESDTLHEVKVVKKGLRRSLVGWAQGPNLR